MSCFCWALYACFFDDDEDDGLDGDEETFVVVFGVASDVFLVSTHTFLTSCESWTMLFVSVSVN